ncbi:hypothetical protein MM326_15000 [Alkalihalobacillus sp. LMS6]|uniref:hypothetical protein n=1 Tax=Alkalihalobacillus sp. LMS6 TaxID=2924034 RepID=UPI0020D1080C|nr:hypothetical protein [Alkalihalobacillus sp. LMS6]UTR05404.1 hypothetical protein MM326_15000 [Alkalihalobacillus sp. LMS6]
MSLPVDSHNLTDAEKRVILESFGFILHYYFNTKQQQDGGWSKEDYEKLALINSIQAKWALGIELND